MQSFKNSAPRIKLSLPVAVFEVIVVHVEVTVAGEQPALWLDMRTREIALHAGIQVRRLFVEFPGHFSAVFEYSSLLRIAICREKIDPI